MSMEKLEHKVGRFLQGALSIAGFLLVAGWLMRLSQQMGLQDFGSLREYNSEPLVERVQWALLLKDQAQLIALAGLFALVMIPVFRVFLTSVLLFREKDYKLALISSCVFVAMIVSFLLGVAS